MRETFDPGVLKECLRLLADDTTPWPMGWFLTEILDGWPEAVVDDLNVSLSGPACLSFA